jgi:hypothetical protein
MQVQIIFVVSKRKTFLLSIVPFLAIYSTNQGGTSALLAANLDNLNIQVDRATFLFSECLSCTGLRKMFCPGGTAPIANDINIEFYTK